MSLRGDERGAGGIAAAGLDEAARRCRPAERAWLIGALDETGQEKQGYATAGVQRQYLGCAGRVANGINTVHLSYVRETYRACADRRPAVDTPRADRGPGDAPWPWACRQDLRVPDQGTAGHRHHARTRYADGLRFDFFCGDEVYGNCTELRALPRSPRPGAMCCASRRNFTPHPRPAAGG